MPNTETYTLKWLKWSKMVKAPWPSPAFSLTQRGREESEVRVFIPLALTLQGHLADRKF